MAQTHLLALPNRDLLSSLAFDHYGTRLAASSLDHHIYVLSSDPLTGRWPEDDEDADEDVVVGKSDKGAGQGPAGKGGKTGAGSGMVQGWSAHDGPVVKVVWADPVHGQILASAGSDGTVRIWEEVPTPNIPSQHSGAGTSGTSAPTWHLRARLLVSRNSVRDLGFSPPEFGLKLAVLSADSHLRIYECLDVGSLRQDAWSLVVDVEVGSLPLGVGGRKDQLADGGKGNAFAYGAPPTTGASNSAQGSTARGPNQPLTSIKGFDIGSSSRPAPSSSQQPSSFSNFSTTSLGAGSSSSGGGNVESEGGWALSWCPEHWWGELVVVSAGSSGLVRLIRFGSPPALGTNSGGGKRYDPVNAAPGEWEVLQALAPPTASERAVPPIASLAWAPPCGRDFHLIAAGHRDGRVRIWRLDPPALSPSGSSSAEWTSSLDAELSSHVRTASSTTSSADPASKASTGGTGQCEWNVTGTVLSTSGADGKVRIWKRGFNGNWVEVGVVGCEDGTEEEGEGEEGEGEADGMEG